MKRNKVISQLNDLRDDSKFNLKYEYDEVWADDVIALGTAIKAVRKDKQANEEFWKGWTIATLIMLIFHFLWLL